MPSLRDLQIRTYRAIARGIHTGLVEHLRAGGAAPVARIQVYENNLRETARKTLAADYPVVGQLVGEGCFRNLARVYLSRFPSRSADLGDFGSRFPQFLDDFYRSTDYEYVAAVAALEQSLVEAELAADVTPLSPAELQYLQPSDVDRIRFSIHPAVRVLQSGFAFYSIWRAHQDDDFSGINSGHGECALVQRYAGRVNVRPIDAASFAFISGLSQNRTLGAAEADALAIDGDFDATAALTDLYRSGALVGIHDQSTLSNGGSDDDHATIH